MLSHSLVYGGTLFTSGMAATEESICNANAFLSECNRLKRELQEKELEIKQLKQLLESKLESASTCHIVKDVSTQVNLAIEKNKLSNGDISRYSRQLILPEIGVKGQLSLTKTSVLIVGAGGLGCPVALYLAAAGIGCLGIVDYDEVELSNLHRQVLHTESRLGIAKCLSMSYGCNQLNSSVRCIPYHLQLDSSNANQLIQQYDIVVDATDNVATRYLLNDACVLMKKPLVSGSALRFEGQLTVYNYQDGPCYRCVYPTPPPPETVTNCSDGGVLGVVPGIIGCLQALEVIKIATGAGTSYSQRLLLFDGLEGSVRTIKLRGKQKSCLICGENPTITELIDYEQFCGARATDKAGAVNLLKPEDRISAQVYKTLQSTDHVLIDVRQPVEMDICQLPGAINIPIDKLTTENATKKIKETIRLVGQGNTVPVYIVCRLGNDSQRAVRILQEKLKDCPIILKDINGGLLGWSKNVDINFPRY